MTKVYRYGVVRILENEDLVRRQMLAAHRVFNQLIAIERDRRQTYEALRRAAVPEIAEAEEELEAARKALMAARIAILAARAGKGDPGAEDEAKQEAKVAKQALRDAEKRLAEVRKAADALPNLQEIRAKLDAETREKVLALYAEVVTRKGEVYWPTWNAVKADADRAVKDARPEWPRFRPWQGEGRLSYQVIGKMPATRLGSNQHVVIVPVSPRAHDPATPRGERRRLCRTVALFRIGSQGPRKTPVWAKLAIVYHRPIPADAVICGAELVLRRVADREKWFLCVTVEEPEPAVVAPRPGIVAIDLGWRDREGNGTPPLRVGYCYDYLGRECEIAIPMWTHSGIVKADGIRSVRDKLRDEIRAYLHGVWKETKDGDPLREILGGVWLWRRGAAFVTALRKMREAGIEGEVVERLAAWYHRDRHLWQYEAGMRRGAILHRNDWFRRIATQICQAYGTIILENFRLPEVIEEPDPEDLPPRDPKQERRVNKAHHQRFVAAVGVFRQYLFEAAAKYGARVILVPPEHTTADCHVCGHRETWDRWQLDHRCEACGAEWDQDANAARNLLARGGVAMAERGPLADDNPLKVKRLPRFHKRHKPKGEGETGDRSQGA